MTLFDALANFVGFLEVGLVILIIKEFVALATGDSGGMMNIKNPLKEGRADEVKEELDIQRADKDAKAAEKKDVQEQKEVQMMNAAVGKIDSYKAYELKQIDWLIRAIKDTIGVLQKYKGRLDANGYQIMSQKIGQLLPAPAKLKQETDQLRALIIYLEKAEVVEANQAVGTLTKVYTDMNGRINSSLRRARKPDVQKQLKRKLAELSKLRGVITKEINDIRAQMQNEMKVTKNILEPAVNKMEQVEQGLNTIVTEVVEELRLGNNQQAISYLKKATGLLEELRQLLGAISNADKKIKAEIARQFNDLVNEKKLTQRMDLELQALMASAKP